MKAFLFWRSNIMEDFCCLVKMNISSILYFFVVWVEKGPWWSSHSNPPSWTGTPSARPRCPEFHPAWPEHLQGCSIHNIAEEPDQCLTSIPKNNFLLISNLNVLSFRLNPFSVVLSPPALADNLAPSFL